LKPKIAPMGRLIDQPPGFLTSTRTKFLAQRFRQQRRRVDAPLRHEGI
jgi:hypothetical protein